MPKKIKRKHHVLEQKEYPVLGDPVKVFTSEYISGFVPLHDQYVGCVFDIAFKGKLKILDVDKNIFVSSISLGTTSVYSNYIVTYLSDGNVACIKNASTIDIWDIKTNIFEPNLLFEFKSKKNRFHGELVSLVEISKNCIASADFEGNIFFWEKGKDQPINILESKVKYPFLIHVPFKNQLICSSEYSPYVLKFINLKNNKIRQHNPSCFHDHLSRELIHLSWDQNNIFYATMNEFSIYDLNQYKPILHVHSSGKYNICKYKDKKEYNMRYSAMLPLRDGNFAWLDSHDYLTIGDLQSQNKKSASYPLMKISRMAILSDDSIICSTNNEADRFGSIIFILKLKSLENYDKTVIEKLNIIFPKELTILTMGYFTTNLGLFKYQQKSFKQMDLVLNEKSIKNLK